jgi:hypothetical protein
MKPEDRIKGLISQSDVVTGPESDKRILGDALDHLERRRQPGRAGSPWDIWGTIGKLAAAAVIVIAAFIGIHQIAAPGIAWADVAERFRTVPFFSATIYFKEDVASEPEQMELWMNRMGKIRMRLGTQVIFGNHGEIVESFDIKTRARVEPDERASFFLRKIGEADEFSLDTIIRVMFGGTMQDVTPLINPDAVISQDMVVFDVEIPWTPEWVRIWALRESRLPVRIRVWDPRDGDSTDAIFEYSKEQTDEFFDPNAFENLLKTGRTSSRVNLAYAFLKDPGGKTITPEDMFAVSGYHMPEVQHVGITPDGAVWVIADRGRNRTSNGYHFYGFSQIEDDLEREYRRVYASHRTATDQSMDVFVPIDYPFDERTPNKITLTCQNDSHPHIKQDVVGTVDLTEWKQDQFWPEDTINSSEQQLAITLAWRHCNAKRDDKVKRILAAITGEPEGNPAALDRERIRLRMLMQEGKTDEAIALGERLMPPLEKRYRQWAGWGPDPHVFTDYVLALVYAGKLDQAKQTWHRIKSIEPEWHPRLTKSSRKRLEEDLRHDFEICVRTLAPQMSREAHLTIDQINDILDIDIKKSDQFRHFAFWDWNPEFEKPKYKNWEKHLAELADYYRIHSLPETMELIEHKKEEEYAARFTKMPGIEDYRVELLNAPLKNYACYYNFPESVGRIRIEGDIPGTVLSHDLIYKSDIPQQQRIRFLLNRFGLEIVEVNEPRTVWIARHDGRKLKDYKEVRAPVPYDASGEIKTGMRSSSAAAGFNLEYLFRNFMYWQNKDYLADCIILIDETGITEKISREGPCWEGPEAPEMARKWFKAEMGITFTEETRTMKTWIVRKKQ